MSEQNCPICPAYFIIKLSSEISIYTVITHLPTIYVKCLQIMWILTNFVILLSLNIKQDPSVNELS